MKNMKNMATPKPSQVAITVPASPKPKAGKHGAIQHPKPMSMPKKGG